MAWTPELRLHTKRERGKVRRWYTFEIGGKEHYLGSDKRAALAKAGQLQAEHYGQTPVDGTPETVVELVERRKLEFPNRHRWNLTPWAEYARSKEGVPWRLDDLTPDHLEGYATWLRTRYRHRPGNRKNVTAVGLKPRSVRQYVWAAATTCAWAVDRGWMTRAPRLPKRLPKPVETARDLSPAQLATMFQQIAGLRIEPLLRFQVEVGARPSEVCRLRWDAVDLARRVCVLTEHKTAHSTGRSRTVYLTDAAVALLEKQDRTCEWVFPSRLGKPYTRDGLRAILQRHFPDATPYQLRHTFAQFHTDNDTLSDRDLAGLLGHSSTRMVTVYRKIRETRLRSVAARLPSPVPPLPVGSAAKPSAAAPARPAASKQTTRKRATG